MTVEMIANVGGGWLRNQATSGQPGHLLSEQRRGIQGKRGLEFGVGVGGSGGGGGSYTKPAHARRCCYLPRLIC